MSANMEGGAYGGVDDLYREVILDHFKAPKNKGRVANANADADGMNPLCGDQIHISAMIEDNKVKDVKFEGHGCAISQSAASIMTHIIKGKSLDDIKEMSFTYKSLFGVEAEEKKGPLKFEIDDLGDTVALEGVKKYPVRIKCALLSWNTLLEAFKNFSKK